MRILMLGNSFTYYHHMPDLLAELTGAEVHYHTHGGAHLREHLDPGTDLGALTLPALEDQTWDYVVLQEFSNGPILEKEDFFHSIKVLCQKSRAAGATPVLYATWPYQQGGGKMAEMERLGISYDDMASGLEAAYQQAARDNKALIAEVGQRFYELSPTMNLYVEDSMHPSREGSRIAAETIAGVIREDRQK